MPHGSFQPARDPRALLAWTAVASVAGALFIATGSWWFVSVTVSCLCLGIARGVRPW